MFDLKRQKEVVLNHFSDLIALFFFMWILMGIGITLFGGIDADEMVKEFKGTLYILVFHAVQILSSFVLSWIVVYNVYKNRDKDEENL